MGFLFSEPRALQTVNTMLFQTTIPAPSSTPPSRKLQKVNTPFSQVTSRSKPLLHSIHVDKRASKEHQKSIPQQNPRNQGPSVPTFKIIFMAKRSLATICNHRKAALPCHLQSSTQQHRNFPPQNKDCSLSHLHPQTRADQQN